MPRGLHIVFSRPAVAESWLRADGLCCERGERVLFEALDIALAPGDILQIEGANGSGKTSLLRILAGLLAPTDGTLRWRGTDIDTVREVYRAQLVYIGHKDGLKAELTARENLAFGLALSGRAPSQPIDAALDTLCLSAHVDTPIGQLSAGQRRRVALARVLIVPASLWLLDEPFTALDRTGIAQIESLLRSHAQRGGMAIVSTHHALQLPCRRLRLSAESA